jgi:hypothetical protein
VAKLFSSRSGSFWKADWLAGVLIVLAVVLLHLNTDVVGRLERRFYDFSSTSTSRQPSDRIAVMAAWSGSIGAVGEGPETLNASSVTASTAHERTVQMGQPSTLQQDSKRRPSSLFPQAMTPVRWVAEQTLRSSPDNP